MYLIIFDNKTKNWFPGNFEERLGNDGELRTTSTKTGRPIIGSPISAIIPALQ